MIRDMTEDCAVLQSGYWHARIDTARPHFISLRADPKGRGNYGQDILEAGWGADSVIESAETRLSSRHGQGHRVTAEEDGRLCIAGMRLGEVARLDWTVQLCGEKTEVLRLVVRRELLQPVAAVTDVVFGLHALREFAFWSRPSLRLGHDTPHDKRSGYCPYEERRVRRVIGYHSRDELERCIIHGSPSYPDIVQRISGGFHHLEQHYTQHVTFGLSSADFSAGPQVLPAGTEEWTIEFTVSPQGALAPVTFVSGNPRVDAFVPAFFDGYLLSSVACDHEYFGNNPYRHAYCPGALDHLARGFMATDRRSWSEPQGDIEERLRTHLRRTLAEGVRADGRLMILLDSGVWQDACGAATGESVAWSLEAQFVNACALHLLKTGDRAFAAEIYPDLRRRVDDFARLDTDGDGLLENPIPGTPGSPASCYNDNIHIGHKDGYLNAGAYEAFRRIASLAEWLGDEAAATVLRGRAERLAAAYNAQLWDEKAGHYVGWIDVNGRPYDAWFTFINFPALSAGLVPPERARRLMASFLAHPNHHRIFAAGVNLDSWRDIPGESFGEWLNGGALLAPAAHELYARAVGLGGEGAWEMLGDLIAQWERDRLCATPLYDWVRPTATETRSPARGWEDRIRQGLKLTGKNAFTWIHGDGATGCGTEPYLADGGSILWALYEGVCGIRADFQGVTLAPRLPAALRDLTLAVRLLGRRLEVQYRGHGDRLLGLRVNGTPWPTPPSIPWSALPDGARVEVEVGE
jgi:hypothetical protein